MNKSFTYGISRLWQLSGQAAKSNRLTPKTSLSKRTYALLLCILTLAIQAFNFSTAKAQSQARNITVQGTVIDNDDSEPLIGVTISDSKKRSLTITNSQGTFAVTVPAGSTLQIGYIGYTSETRVFNTSQSKIVIRLKRGSSQLNEVVVTALGIKREERALGYSAPKLDSTAFTKAPASNWTDALSGKVAGLNQIGRAHV